MKDVRIVTESDTGELCLATTTYTELSALEKPSSDSQLQPLKPDIFDDIETLENVVFTSVTYLIKTFCFVCKNMTTIDEEQRQQTSYLCQCKSHVRITEQNTQDLITLKASEATYLITGKLLKRQLGLQESSIENICMDLLQGAFTIDVRSDKYLTNIYKFTADETSPVTKKQKIDN